MKAHIQILHHGRQGFLDKEKINLDYLLEMRKGLASWDEATKNDIREIYCPHLKRK